MSDFHYLASHLVDEEAAEKYLAKYCFEMDLFTVEKNRLECVTKLCKLGESTVSITSSPTGWGYKVRSEADGFLFTLAQEGNVVWESGKQRMLSKANAGLLIDHRELTMASYSRRSQYLAIYVAHTDLIKYLSMLNGETQASRLVFKKNECGVLITEFMKSVGSTIISLASGSDLVQDKVLTHLKESLMCFIVYNMENNYSQLLTCTRTLEAPTPYTIKRTVEYVEHHYDRLLTLSDLAAFSGVSVRSLQLGFKQFKECTPMSYLRDVRLKKAHVMLKSREHPIRTPKEIAALCGFTNFYLFDKYYTSTFGERPIETLRANSFI